MTRFTLNLPTIQVTDLADDYRLDRLAEDLRHHKGRYTFEDERFENILADETTTIERVAGGVVVHYAGSTGEVRDFIVATYRTYEVASSNGVTVLTDEAGVRDGYFDTLPEALFRPNRGTQIESGEW